MLNMTNSVYEAIIAHAQKGMPHEVCGYLAAREGRVVAHYEMTNTDAAADHFSMRPEEQFKALKDIRGKGLTLKAVYHSHPETPARPSEEDIRLAFDPEVSYVIISLAGTDPVLKSFRISQGKVSVEQISMGTD